MGESRRSSLEAARAAAVDALARARRGLDAARSARGDEGDDEHDPEGSTIASEWSRLDAAVRAASARLAAADAALARLDDGTDGRCATCGSAIGAARLEAVPTATECIGCASLRR